MILALCLLEGTPLSGKNVGMLDFAAFRDAIAPYSSIGITAPAGADGDSVGTQSSLRELLLQIFPQKTFRIINEEPCPVRYRSLPQAAFFEVSSDILKKQPSTWPEVMICVDGGASRIGAETTQIWKAAKKCGQVDHHAVGGNVEYDFRLYDPKAASTTEIVFKFANALSLKITPEIAQAIYVGLVFDTGLFKHNNAKPETLRIAADLMETRFDHTRTVEEAMLIRSPGAFSMLKYVLSKANSAVGGKYTWGVLDYSAFQECGGDSDDREGLIDQLFLIRGCVVAALYFEKSPGDWKISFRSRGPDVAKLARSLNPEGGGHFLAAGCSLTGSEAEVLKICHQAVESILT